VVVRTNVELWTAGISMPGRAARQAERAEEAGWDGITFVDSQNLSGDTYVALAMAARATSRLKLSTGVTNPFTRHAAVTASAIATVQVESNGRAILGIGRGDSALAHLGFEPAPLAVFDEYLKRLQAYLRGEEVAFGEGGTVRSLGHNLPLADAPTGSRIEWLRSWPDLPKVPVDVAATGPKVMKLAAAVADRVTLAVGADPARVAWGIDTIRATNPDVSVGAYVNVVIHDDRAVAFDLARGGLTSFARFSVMHGTATGPVTAEQREVLERIPEQYDMNHHFRSTGAQTKVVTPEFADRFGILGPADHCVEKLQELIRLGLDHIHVIGPSKEGAREENITASRRFVAEVMPELRSLR
jgi:5,10-methylenetetrahydromethanopterin reductase